MIEWGYAPNVQETTPTQGTGDYALAGPVPDFEALRDRYADGARPFLVITDGDGNREWGVYTLTHGDPDTLARTEILGSTNGGAAVNWPDTSDKHVYSAPLPEIENGKVTLFAGEDRPAWLPADSVWLKTDAAPGPTLQLYDGSEDLPLGARENLIVNGDFRVAQRGTSFAAAASGDTTLDLWRYFKTGAMVHSIAQSADVPSVAEAGVLAAASLHVDCTTADASLAGTDNAGIYHRIEGWRFRAIAQRAFTLTFWAKATKPGVYCVSFRNAGPDFRSYVAEYTVEAAGAWERKTITVPASPAAGDWDYGAGIGLQVIWSFGTGPTLQTTPGVWQTGNFSGTASQVNACDSAANDFRLALVQLVPGEGRVPFRPRDFAEELALCQRYVEKSYDHAVAPGTSLSNPGVVHLVVPSNTIAAGQEYGSIRFAAPKRAAPTVTIYGYTGGSGVVSNTSGTERPANSGAVQMAGESGFTVFNNSGGDVTTTGNVVMFHWLASAEL